MGDHHDLRGRVHVEVVLDVAQPLGGLLEPGIEVMVERVDGVTLTVRRIQ
jgi:membrane protein implicated in regulation of membrane protease activity